MGYLTEKNGEKSSVRIVLIATIALVTLLVFAMIYHILFSETIDWGGMALFLTAITALLGSVLYGKVKQKKIEQSEE